MKGQGSPWNMKSQGSNVTQRSSWNSIYVTFSFMRKTKTSLLVLTVERLMRADYSPHLFSPLSCKWMKYFVSLISCYSYPFADYYVMMWMICISSDVHMCCELFPSTC